MKDHGDILVLEDMIEEFDREQPSQGRETTAFIKRWRKKEMALKHRSPSHLARAVHLLNRAEVESMRETKWARDEERTEGNQLVRLTGRRRNER